MPAKVSDDRVIVTAGIDGRKVNFRLDSGASGTLLDRGIAQATNVRSYGSATEVTAGEYQASDAIAPQLALGDASMKDVAPETAPFHYAASDGAPVAGLLGYDFFASGVVHIDYEHGTADVFHEQDFGPPAGAVSLPVRLVDGVPVVQLSIGSSIARNFIVDTGADRSMIFSRFAHTHHADVPSGFSSEL